eukprot:g29999.t1
MEPDSDQDIAIYRGIENFLLQFGVVEDPKRAGGYEKIMDDPLCGVPYLEGMVGFAAAGPNTRTQQLCLFLGSAPSLGKNSVETPIGRVAECSLGTLRKIQLMGDIPQCGGSGPDPQKLANLGNAYIAENFPKCDFITGASRRFADAKAALQAILLPIELEMFPGVYGDIAAQRAREH